MTKKQTKRILRIVFIIASISSLVFAPWILVKAWIIPLPDKVQEQVNEAIGYLKQGILSGWEMKSIKKNEYLKPLLKGEEWKSIKKDRLYLNLIPQLKQSLINGQISPYEFAGMDDWYHTTKYDRTRPTYGILDPPSQSNLSETNELRETLVDIQKKTGMNFICQIDGIKNDAQRGV